MEEYLTDNNISVINALRSTLHDGSESVDYGRPGHITNSINIPSLDMIDNETKLYKPLDELEKIFSKYEVLNKQKVMLLDIAYIWEVCLLKYLNIKM